MDMISCELYYYFYHIKLEIRASKQERDKHRNKSTHEYI